jgi:hypothetical protein
VPTWIRPTRSYLAVLVSVAKSKKSPSSTFTAEIDAPSLGVSKVVISPERLAESVVLIKYLSPPEIVGLLSCFTNCIGVADENKVHVPETDYDETNRITKKAEEILMSYSDEEAKYELYTGETYDFTYDLLNPVIRWCEAEDEKDCKIIIQELKQKEVFLGDFVKALLKINNIASEMEKMCETTGQIELLEKVSQIPSLTLKYVVTNQSLYI